MGYTGFMNQDTMTVYAPIPGAILRPGSVPISVTIITKNESANIASCLSSVAFAAQVVVVDAESTDGTAEIARELGATVYVRPWPGFTQQRNFSISLCDHDWILSVDADERVSLELAMAIAVVMRETPRFDGYRVAELNNYFGRWLKHGGIYPGHHVSLFDRRKGMYQAGAANVHEDVHFKVTGLLDGHMLHHAYPSFHLALKKLNSYTDLEAQGRFEKGIASTAYGILWRPFERFFKNFVLKRGFLDGVEGFLYCFLCCLYAFSTAVKLRELCRQSGKKTGEVLAFPAESAHSDIEKEADASVRRRP
jgi:glycosyltransferase involved in cell wall biosynthesis